MGAAIAEFLMIIGPDVTAPTNMVELIPYLLTVFCGIVAVVCCFKLVIAIANSIATWRKF